MISRGIVPNLIIAQRVVDRVVEAAKHYLADETGETMVGFVVPAENIPESMPTLYVLDTISPDENAIRRSHMFEQGDELQQDIFFWLSDNWETCRELGKDARGRPIHPRWNQPLRHMGDWHKQPGFMIQPSGGDLMTALRFMEDEENDFDFLLVPIVTLGHDSVTNEDGAQVNYFTVALEDGTSLRMDWWYIHRDSRFFQPITPRIVPNEQLPELTPYPWHILAEDLVNDELDILELNGYFRVGDFVLWNTDGKPPLEICFIIGRPGTSQVYLVVTDWDYPNTPPRLYLSQFKDIDPSMYIYDIWQRLWEQRTPPPSLSSFRWTEETLVVDVIKAVETAQGLAHPTPRRAEPPASGPVRIPVQVEEKKVARPTPPTDEPAKDDVE
ncbi:hypothetical protein VZO05_11110 [Aggregatilineales bacterium SYSU G02658]